MWDQEIPLKLIFTLSQLSPQAEYSGMMMCYVWEIKNVERREIKKNFQQFCQVTLL